MTEQNEPQRKLPDWMADHMRRYVDSNGEDGHIWNGVPCLLLTTTGRRSGRPLMIPLIYGQDGDRYLVVASRGGHKYHPRWYLNLVEHPEVRIQVAADRFTARARTATEKEKAALWEIMARIFPAYDEYQQKTVREIPVILLEKLVPEG